MKNAGSEKCCCQPKVINFFWQVYIAFKHCLKHSFCAFIKILNYLSVCPVYALFIIYLYYFLIFFMSDRKLFQPFSFWYWSIASMFNRNFCNPRISHFWQFFSVRHFSSDMLHNVSKLDVFRWSVFVSLHQINR